MSNTVNLKAKGLFTFANFLSEIPEGALFEATNVVIDRDGIIEPRRGIKDYKSFGVDGDIAKQLLNYKNRVLVHFGSTMAYDPITPSVAFSNFTGTFPETQAGLRVKGIESNGNFYVTTAEGIKKIAAATSDLSLATVTESGVPKALDADATPNYINPGFLVALSTVGYRIVWGTKDVNDNLLLGAPSGRFVVYNYSTTLDATVDIRITIPSAITTNHFFQIYRTATVTAPTLDLLTLTDPGDEMKLVYEAAVTAPDLVAGEVFITDIVPDAFQQGGTALYTNPVSGEGINQSNNIPPVAKDIELFRGSAFFANTRTQHNLNLALLGLGGMENNTITNITTDTITTTITTADTFSLANGDRVAIVGTGAALVDAVHIISNVTPTSFDIPVDGTGAAPTTGSWFSSYITVTDGTTTNRYFFIGRPEVTRFTFDTQANTTDGGWFEISSAEDLIRYAVWYDKTGETTPPIVPGAFLIRVRIALAFDPLDVDTTDDTINIVDHALEEDQLVTFTSTGTLPAPLVSGTDYYVINPDSTSFQVSATLGGAAIDLTTQGTGVHTLYINGATANTSVATKAAVEAATVDFVIEQTSGTQLTFVTANNGSAQDAAAGTTPPDAGFAAAILIQQQGFGEDATNNYVRLSGYASAGQAVDDTARSLVKIINLNDLEIVQGSYISGPTDAPGLMNFERKDFSEIPFTFQANNATVGALFNPDLTTAQASTNESVPNRVYFSKYQQPEAVPILNFIDVGRKDKAILRIVALRDSLFILKEDGVYRLVGDIAPNFSVSLFDGSCQLRAPDTCAVLNNQIYMFSDDGIVTVTETGVEIISRPIENIIIQLLSDNFPGFSTASFGVAYHTEHSYYLWTVTNTTDDVATQMFRYNTFTRTWTKWDVTHTCGMLDDGTNNLFFGADNDNMVEVERKTLSRRDYADKEFSVQILANPIYANNNLQLSSTQNLSEGDALVQTQYLTISQYNSLLKKLDADPRIGLAPGTFFTDYFASLEMVKGDNLTNKMAALVAKLNLDPGTSGGYTFNGSSVFSVIQTQFNLMVAQLNLDPLLFFTNYQTSVGTVDFEMTIVTASNNTNTVTSTFIPAFVVGPLTAFKGIRSRVSWAPNSLGDPSLLKHVSESTILFEASNFRGGNVGYNSDLSPDFESTDFIMDGSGVWGGFFWGNGSWGGAGSSVPFRTYVPRQKQRCRYIRAKFEHNDAFYKYSILGLSYYFEVSSQRAYRGKS